MGFGLADKVLDVMWIPLLVHECMLLLEGIIGMIIILKIAHEIGGEIFALRSLELEVGLDIALIFRHELEPSFNGVDFCVIGDELFFLESPVGRLFDSALSDFVFGERSW